MSGRLRRHLVELGRESVAVQDPRRLGRGVGPKPALMIQCDEVIWTASSFGRAPIAVTAYVAAARRISRSLQFASVVK